MFQGLIFDVHGDRTQPMVQQVGNEEEVLADKQKCLDFLGLLQREGFLNEGKRNGLVLYADDQYINEQAMEMNLKDVGLDKNYTIVSNGQEVLDSIDEVLAPYYEQPLEQATKEQPIALLLLDINMPIMNGFDVLPLVKVKFDEINTKRLTQFNDIMRN